MDLCEDIRSRRKYHGKIHMQMLRYDVVKGNTFTEMVNFVFHLAITPCNVSYKSISHIDSKSVHSPVKCHRFRPSMPNSFPASTPILKNGQKLPFFGGRVISFERSTRFTVKDGLYSRPIFSQSNGAYRVSLRPSIPEQSTQDRSGVAPFFAPSIFLGLMLNQ